MADGCLDPQMAGGARDRAPSAQNIRLRPGEGRQFSKLLMVMGLVNVSGARPGVSALQKRS
jgi:urease beta subunit